MHKLIALVMVLMAVCFARADITDQYLYWMIDQPSSSETIKFFYAQLYADNGTEKIVLEPYVLASDAVVEEDPPPGKFVTPGTRTEPTYASLAGLLGSDYSSYYFYVELFDGSDNLLGASQSVAYENLTRYIYSNLSLDGEIAYAFVPTVPVPEPTSGLLVSLGLALLALRRRRPASVA